MYAMRMLMISFSFVHERDDHLKGCKTIEDLRSSCGVPALHRTYAPLPAASTVKDLFQSTIVNEWTRLEGRASAYHGRPFRHLKVSAVWAKHPGCQIVPVTENDYLLCLDDVDITELVVETE
jgi:hypothetical protein